MQIFTAATGHCAAPLLVSCPSAHKLPPNPSLLASPEDATWTQPFGAASTSNPSAAAGDGYLNTRRRAYPRTTHSVSAAAGLADVVSRQRTASSSTTGAATHAIVDDTAALPPLQPHNAQQSQQQQQLPRERVSSTSSVSFMQGKASVL